MSIYLNSSANISTANSTTNLDISLYNQTIDGIITDDHRSHFYGMNLTTRSSLSISLDNSLGNGDVQIINSQGVVVGGSYNRGRRDEWIEQTLEAGEYRIHVFGVGQRDTSYRLHVNQVNNPVSNPFPASGLFQKIGGEVQTRIQDGLFDRNDAIAIFNMVMDGGVIDGVELRDLQTLFQQSDNLNIPDFVRILANKVINGDPANQFYQGQSLGNIQIGNSASHLQNLVDKWFFGSDRPATSPSSTYQYASGELFQNGTSYEDIRQGQINDCYFLTGLALKAVHQPNAIANMFINNGDDTYTVKFWRNQTPDYVTVDRFLPVDSNGNLIYANQGNNINNPSNELWVALAQKAYAQLNASGWLNQEPGNSYLNIGKGGYISDALKHITGKVSSPGNLLNFNHFFEAINNGKWIGLGTKSKLVNDKLIPNHAYALIGYDSVNQTFQLFNPWGVGTAITKPGIVELNWNELLANISYWDGVGN